MIYVFTFLGEFGYELLNWQGVIRKFSQTLGPHGRIVCCSRANLYPLYETASLYIDISEVELFKNSQASCYFALLPGSSNQCSEDNVAFDKRLKSSLRSFIADRLPRNNGRWLPWFNKEKTVLVFSSDKVQINGCTFGCDRNLFDNEGTIYDRLELSNNVYGRIEPDLTVRGEIERRIGFDLSEPYILVQGRTREIGTRSTDVIPKERLIEVLAENGKVVLLSFTTGRKLDSYSRFDTSIKCHHFSCRSFVEQACLVHFARSCLFFTEGDFGSHMYVPPFMGKDVVAIAPRSVYELETTPISFWNRNVFSFGGRIIPKISEEIFANRQSLVEVVDEVLSR